MPTTAPLYLAAPADLEPELYVHGISGRIVPVRIVGFKIVDDVLEPLVFPRIAENTGWEKIENQSNGYVSAHGRQGLNPTDLANSVRLKRPIQ